MTCAATKQSGEPCQGLPLPGKPFCLFHDPASRRILEEARSEGGKRPRMPPPLQALGADVPDLGLDGKADVLALLKDTANNVRKGVLTPEIGRCLAQIGSVALAAFKADDTDKRIRDLEGEMRALKGLSSDDLLKIVQAGQKNGVAVVASGH